SSLVPEEQRHRRRGGRGEVLPGAGRVRRERGETEPRGRDEVSPPALSGAQRELAIRGPELVRGGQASAAGTVSQGTMDHQRPADRGGVTGATRPGGG